MPRRPNLSVDSFLNHLTFTTFINNCAIIFNHSKAADCKLDTVVTEDMFSWFVYNRTFLTFQLFDLWKCRFCLNRLCVGEEPVPSHACWMKQVGMSPRTVTPMNKNPILRCPRLRKFILSWKTISIWSRLHKLLSKEINVLIDMHHQLIDVIDHLLAISHS